eukprot:CAMPEP_0170608236 /NCGR_PEP_ID=MMETSP0224-20130122/21479_1 /TAXON_ID=285029 /ORGANISM="Togula jolla, Strain CCCM 725" /LENGTH=283 /DNA_ID=CAMNT_0010933453 /DNA_START=81 /DNA_END=932 /DNA_ORIENTATION=+
MDNKIAAATGANSKLQVAALIVPLLVALFIVVRGSHVKSFFTFTETAPWVWEMTAMGYMMKVAIDQLDTVKGYYWAHGVFSVALMAFGGGFLAPLIVAHSPVPLVEETYVWMVVVAWYVTVHVPRVSQFLVEMNKSKTGRVMFIVFFAIFKTNQIVGGCELGASAVPAEALLPHSRYFRMPWAAPLLCGFLSGCGGGLVLDKDQGLSGGKWSIRASFFAPVFYYVTTRIFGVEKLNAKLATCLIRVISDLFPTPRDQVVGRMTTVGYRLTGFQKATILPVKGK